MPYMNNGVAVVEHVLIDSVRTSTRCALAIDGSTTNTGMAIVDLGNASLNFSMSFERDKVRETPVMYKLELKGYIKELLEKNPTITDVVYEEPFCGHETAAANLFMLRTVVEELIVENKPRFDYIKYIEVNNMKWKKKFFAPEKVPSGTDKQKKAIKNKIVSAIPALSELTQDECDAYGLGLVYASAGESINDAYTKEELKTQKKAKPFTYEIRFIGSNDDDDAFDQVMNVFDGPTSVAENGISLEEINGRGNFDKHIYDIMGNDDKVIVVKFKSTSHTNVVLQYRIGVMASSYDYIYAVVWRKNRKRK